MHVETLFQELSRFHQVICNANLGISFNLERVKPHQGLFKNWFRSEVPGVGASDKSGIYIIADPGGEALYIGKATAGNLGAEIWGKFNAASRLDPDDTPHFENSSLAKWAPNDTYRDMLVRGDVQIHTATIEPREISSLAEVYLQTWCHQNGKVPYLNKRIG